jgi:hypothetical protein
MQASGQPVKVPVLRQDAVRQGRRGVGWSQAERCGSPRRRSATRCALGIQHHVHLCNLRDEFGARWWLVEDVWNYATIRMKLNSVLGELWGAKRRRYGYGLL